jgi:hypothetical protein
MFAGDLNADGVTDLAVGHNGGANKIGVFISNGNGTFQPIVNFAPTPQSSQIKGADINRDGIIDIIAYASGNLLVLPGHVGAWTSGGAEAFSVRPLTTTPGGSFFTTVDVNGDGALDLAMGQSDPGRVRLALGSAPASATFGPTLTYGTAGTFGTTHPAAADFNGDGFQDLVVSHQIGSSLQVFLGNASGTLTPLATVVPGGSTPKSSVVADFNGDGMLDVACVHNGGVGVHLGNGAGGLGASTNFTTSQATTLATADMNNDGKPDLIASSQTLGYYLILLNTTPATSFTTQPLDRRICPGGGSGAVFNAAAVTNQVGGITGYRWERRVGSAWEQLVDGPLAGVGTIATSSTNTLQVGGVPGSPGATVMTVRAVATTVCGPHVSLPATLSLIAPCGGADVGATGGVFTGCGDGVLDNNDFVVYIDLFFNGDVIADVGSQGGVPGADGQFNNNDFVVFIDMFFSGCTI